MQQIAWGDSLPHVPDPKNPPKNPQPRSETEAIDMPDIGPLGYVANIILSKIGVAKSNSGFNGTTLTRIDWQDIESWSNVTNTKLTAFEAELARTLSAKYCEMFNLSNLKIMPPPYIDKEKAQERLDQQVVEIFSKRRQK